MIKWWQGLALGALQGATEFLPVSSSGHLALGQSLIKNFQQPGLLFDLALHIATAVAVLVYFWRDILELLKRKREEEAEEKMKSRELKSLNWRLLGIMLISLIPTAIIGYLLKDSAEKAFEKPIIVGSCLLITALILFLADYVAKKRFQLFPEKEPSINQALLIGIAQGLAVFPGISRSGATIATGIFSGVRGDYSARFSFLLSVPAVLGASLLSVLEERKALLEFQAQEIISYLLGMAGAFLVGYLSIRLVFETIKRIKLSGFGIYCLIIGGGVILVQLLS